MNNEKVLESQEYLNRVFDVISRGGLSKENAILASSIKHGEMPEKLKKLLPFPSYVLARTNERFMDVRVTASTFQKPIWLNQTIIKNEDNCNFSEITEISRLQTHQKMYECMDAVGNIIVSGLRYLLGIGEEVPFKDIPFRMLDWDFVHKSGKYKYLTFVGKKSIALREQGYILENEGADRHNTWVQIRDTILCIAADTMKEKGINV